MPSQKQKAERFFWKRLRGFIEFPNPNEDQAGYKAVRRQVEKLTHDPQFMRDGKKQFESFTDFLLHYDLNVADLDLWDNLLVMDMSLRRKKK